MKLHKIIIILAILMLNSCAQETNFRGVPEPVWKQLSLEQKQLIVDQAFAAETTSL